MQGVAQPTQAGANGMVLPTREEIELAFPEYDVQEMIGHGGMGAVFRVRQRNLDRTVALKVLPRSLAADPAFAERFHREARALAKLNHPNIVTVHDFGEQGGWYFLLMELVDGINLRQAMQSNRFTPEQALEIVPKICEALQFAHGEGVLHRDIKPENILLDAKGRVKIADFGIAKLGEAEGAAITLTMSGAQMGTLAYMAPEQIEHPGQVDHRADIYSLGVVFYELLTGELPLGRFAAPSEKSAVNTQVDNVVFRTLEKERERRYQSAGEMKTQVETLVGHSGPALAVPPVPPAAEAKPPGRFSGPGVAFGCLIFGFLLSVATLMGVKTMAQGQASQAVDRASVQIEAQEGQPRPEPAPVVHTRAVAQPGVSFFALFAVMGLPVLLGMVLGWKNLVRLRRAASPRKGIVMASIAALLLPFSVLWIVIATNVDPEGLAWLDAIALTCILLTWFCCWMNPHPTPWSAKAVLAFTLTFVPLLCIAHGWEGYQRSQEIRWAQELNLLQNQINETRRLANAGQAPNEVMLELERRMLTLHVQKRPSTMLPLSGRDRACLGIALLFAIISTLLGWMARADLLKPNNQQRGIGMAKLAAYFWPVAVVPLLLVLLA
jgi:serine/threonine protein kinase